MFERVQRQTSAHGVSPLNLLSSTSPVNGVQVPNTHFCLLSNLGTTVCHRSSRIHLIIPFSFLMPIYTQTLAPPYFSLCNFLVTSHFPILLLSPTNIQLLHYFYSSRRHLFTMVNNILYVFKCFSKRSFYFSSYNCNMDIPWGRYNGLCFQSCSSYISELGHGVGVLLAVLSHF